MGILATKKKGRNSRANAQEKKVAKSRKSGATWKPAIFMMNKESIKRLIDVLQAFSEVNLDKMFMLLGVSDYGMAHVSATTK